MTRDEAEKANTGAASGAADGSVGYTEDMSAKVGSVGYTENMSAKVGSMSDSEDSGAKGGSYSDTTDGFGAEDNAEALGRTDAESDNRDAEPEEADAEGATEEPIDYAALMAEDMRVLKAQFPELAKLRDITELSNPMRYAALRDLGLTAREAYLATEGQRPRDNRSHLTPAAPRQVGTLTAGMTRGELESFRELFSGMSDSEISMLYRRAIR